MSEEITQKYPQHARAEGLKDQRLSIHEFLGWLARNNYTICEWRRDGYLPAHRSDQELLFKYLGPDYSTYNDERELLFEALRTSTP